ncbi:MAG: phosphopyruvate hydratase [Clostridia bacterium]|nr:phosphopyruvate hydratase [Clostridia bacterium]
MKNNVKIEKVEGLEVFDSRGNPTVQVTVHLENGIIGRAIVPSGASTGSYEAVELRDNDKNRLFGKGVKRAVENVNMKIDKRIKGMNVYDQAKIDNEMINLDGTENKSKIGANAILGVSLAVCDAAAKSLNMEVYEYIGGIIQKNLPIPMFNILNGGKHSENNLNMQEFMIIPIGCKSFMEMMQIGIEVYNSLKKVLKQKGYNVGVGDEGGFAPNLSSEEEALDLILKAIVEAGYKPKENVVLALDVASTEMYEEARKKGKKGYYFWKTRDFKTTDEMIKYLESLVKKYPIVSIEDGLAEEDWEGWNTLTKLLGEDIQLVGDDLFVTNLKRLDKGIVEKSANSILIKPNQIGTLTETLQVIRKAKENGFTTVISHRSGETENTIIADIAVATNAGQIKAGAPCRTDRVAKYNRLLNIENQITLLL